MESGTGVQLEEEQGYQQQHGKPSSSSSGRERQRGRKHGWRL